MTATAEQVTDFVATRICPILNKYGAVLIRTYPDAPSQAKLLERFKVLEFEFKGEHFDIDGCQCRPEDIEFLLKHWERVQQVLQVFDTVTDPFHSSIYHAFRQEFDRRTLNHSQLAYSYVCRKIEASGRKVWS